MDESRFGRLNERQKQCLRLYNAKFEAKEIAKRLNISPHTVNEHLRDARRILGVDRSIQAARMLGEYERDNRLGTEPIGVGRPAEVGHAKDGAPARSPASVRRNRYRLGPFDRLKIILALAFGAAALTGALIEAGDVITRLIQTRHIDLSDTPHRQ